MSEFNFKSQICTSLEQSERLLALGLKKETADMYITNMSRKGLNYTDDWQIGSISYCDVMSFWDSKGLQLEKTAWSIIPAWSLHRLLCLLPKHIQVYDDVWKFKRNLYLSIDEDFNIRYEENIDEPCFDKTFWAYDIYQNCIDCIEWLIKEGYFNKEYLV